MPSIYDNITLPLLKGLRDVLPFAEACSFCVGYLNLTGWRELADLLEALPGGSEDRACRVLVGMHQPPEEEMKTLARLRQQPQELDGPKLARFRSQILEGFREQLKIGVPTDEGEAALRALARQLRAGKVFIKAFLRHRLHAKLYLVRRSDPVTPLIGFVGSSNLTLAGLSRQGELNVDVVEQDAAQKLQEWFDQRWQDPSSVDLTEDLAQLIEHSWARETLVRPYLVYLKMAYHLSQEAREGEREFRLPSIFRKKGTPLLDFQEKAVSLAAHHFHRRGGVLLGDVVGLGKTLMAVAIARIFQEDEGANTLVICPPKLAPLWDDHLQRYEIHGRVLSLGKVGEALRGEEPPTYRLLIIDESHNLRHRQGQRYQTIQSYIEKIRPRVLLLTATPYNKQFTDLSNQLRLFLSPDEPLPLRPERFFQEWAAQGKSEADFLAQFQTSPRSLRAFEESPYPEDWRDLMRLFLVRRTRKFIIQNYAQYDPSRQQHFVILNGQRAYFPVRQPKRLTFPIRPENPQDQFARLFREEVVQVIETLQLPRYGLAQYLRPDAAQMANNEEQKILENLNRGGRRLLGFCRTNLFKRLESSGYSFLLSLRRHILRNMVTLHALQAGLPVPIGTQEVAMMDTALNDSDEDVALPEEGEPLAVGEEAPTPSPLGTLADYQARAAKVYNTYQQDFHDRFSWLDGRFFRPQLATALAEDAQALLTICQQVGRWEAEKDAKLAALEALLAHEHPQEKVLVFTQFADTAAYLEEQLSKRGLTQLAVITNQTDNPVALVRRFSPGANGGLRPGESELRLLISTDVLAEGQNLQDAHIVVNYDLPWAIIRLIQRAGRVDRIGQRHPTILVYSFLPAEGVERIIRLRQRLEKRLQENQEVIGTDEIFFDERAAQWLRDLYTEKTGLLDDDTTDEDIDLASLALQVWNKATPEDQKAALALAPKVWATRPLAEPLNPQQNPPGVITFLRYPDGSEALVRVDEAGNLVSQSLSATFRAAACAPQTPPLPRSPHHYQLVRRCAELALNELSAGGQLGSLRSPRRKLWDRLKSWRHHLAGQGASCAQTLQQLEDLLDQLWRHPLQEEVERTLQRQMRLKIGDEELFRLVCQLAERGRLYQPTGEDASSFDEPEIICSLGLSLAEPANPTPSPPGPGPNEENQEGSP